ncbi:hypothetical protein K469DRAFT_243681 [Zopfia rhizophila CBS 207.26]|uniref:Uncharacterized protein n=1 Tax=Zopfia rhizophila CBS 207.26 TaxID=1314779 RepID=A0A6A6EUM1_9PEZI|nr:hypothetical protein K469DRAFT_243681 [Zopfia rhizophila CBS 207.26]
MCPSKPHLSVAQSLSTRSCSAEVCGGKSRPGVAETPYNGGAVPLLEDAAIYSPLTDISTNRVRNAEGASHPICHLRRPARQSAPPRRPHLQSTYDPPRGMTDWLSRC